MSFNKMFAKSFSQYEQKQFRNWAIIGCFILSLSFFILVKPNFGTLPTLNLQVSVDNSLTMIVVESGEVMETKHICNVSDPKFDFCDAEGDIRIHGKSSTIFAASSEKVDLLGNESWTIKPYPRKTDQWMMEFIKEFSVNAIVGHEDQAPHCTVNHSVPAMVFSVGGYAAGNHWHAFTDIFVPLFAASAQFHGEVQFLITNFGEYWIMKYQTILKQLSRYEIINIDTDDNVHCFPRVIVGLKYYKDLRIDPLTAAKGYSMKEFMRQIRNGYSLKKSVAIKIHPDTQEKPKLLILTRNESRTFMNVDEITESAISMGFEVVFCEAMANLDEFAHIVNSVDVMMGIHGAGLTNMVFLPSNAVLIQVLPWGRFEWLASTCFGEPALDTDLKYLEYKIEKEESSLIQQYPLDHPILKDPHSITKANWGLFKSVYLKQNVKINVDRFKATLLEALELLRH